MIAQSTVKMNGKWYKVGEEIPQANFPENMMNYPSEPYTEEKQYTRTDISRMNVCDLRRLALENGVCDVQKMKSADLKKSLLEILGL